MILVPFSEGMLNPKTAAWAEASGARTVDVGGSDDAYWRMLADAWTGDEDLVVVEQDIVPAPGVVAAMTSCQAMRCSSPYLIGGKLLVDHCLGCARFSIGLQRAVPDAVERAGEPLWETEPRRSWWTLDFRLDHVLRSAGHVPHRHARSVHLHDGRLR